MKKTLSCLLAAISIFALNAQEESAPLKDLYPMDSVTVSDDVTQAVEDKLSDILGDLELTEEEKKLLEAPESQDIDDVSEAGTDNVQPPASDNSPEEGDKPAPESPSDEDEASEEDVPAEEEFSEEPSGEKKEFPCRRC